MGTLNKHFSHTYSTQSDFQLFLPAKVGNTMLFRHASRKRDSHRLTAGSRERWLHAKKIWILSSIKIHVNE